LERLASTPHLAAPHRAGGFRLEVPERRLRRIKTILGKHLEGCMDLFPYYSLDEVKKRAPFSEPTLWRLEKSGRFPKRVRLSAKKIFWRKSEIDAWVVDPEGWCSASMGGAA
jgi:prophage regulatory protein